MSDRRTNPLPPPEHSQYWLSVAAEDARLAMRIKTIASKYDQAILTAIEAADARIEALEEHLAAVQTLRHDLLGGS